MLIKNANVLIEKQFVRCSVRFSQQILETGDLVGEGIDAEGCYLSPGLVDLHSHGALGEDFSDGKESTIKKLSLYYGQRGITRFLATTMSLPEAGLFKAVSAVRSSSVREGAICIGIHLEGPFLSSAKRGAQAKENLQTPNEALFDRLQEASGNKIKLITIAPELPHAIEWIPSLSKRCMVSLGHTQCDYITAKKAFEAGANHVTHLFNAMNPPHHREPGLVGAAFDSGASAELICDGFHVHPSAVRAAFKLFGQKTILISDSVRCTGMPDGKYELGGQNVFLKQGRVTLSDGTLAGSAISLLDAVKNAVRFKIPLQTALYAASTAPGRVIKENVQIKPGCRADLALFDSNLNVRAVFVEGRRIV